jgi:hypothetical protein
MVFAADSQIDHNETHTCFVTGRVETDVAWRLRFNRLVRSPSAPIAARSTTPDLTLIT